MHPLPAFCWLWLLAALFLAIIGGLIVFSCFFPSEELLEKLPRDDPRWAVFWGFGIAGLLIGSACGWFWHRFAVKKVLTRKTWHIGTGLILLGAGFLILTSWVFTAICFLMTLAVWMQGHTRQFFDRV